MRQLTTQNWLRKRYEKNTRDYYIKNKSDLQAQYDTENVFMKFDDDNSGSLDCIELKNMFQKHGIEIKYSDIKTLFDIVD